MKIELIINSKKVKIKRKEIHSGIIFLEWPLNVDPDAVTNILGETDYDMIFTRDGIIFKDYKEKEVIEAFQSEEVLDFDDWGDEDDWDFDEK